MAYSTTKRPPGHTLTILTAPAFENTRPPPFATIWRISLSPGLAFKLLCDLEHLYTTMAHRPRIGGMLETDGAITLYLWPHASPDSALLLLLLDYGAARLVDASRWAGQAWLTGDLLGRVLAALATRAYWDMALLSDEVPGYLLSLERQVLP